MDAVISCHSSRAVGSDGACQPTVHIGAGDLHIAVSTEEAGQVLRCEPQVDPYAKVNGGGDHLAVNGRDRGASQPAEGAADMEDEPAVLPPRLISGDEDNVDVMGRASLVSVVGKRGRIFSELQVEDTEDPWELQRLHDAWLAKEFFYKKKKTYFYGPI